MPTKDSYAPGTPSWVDLASPDLEASVSFYGALFGWEAPEGPPENGGYRLFMLGDKPVAGCSPMMMEGQPPAWTTYVSVDDADKTIAQIKTAGGTVFVEPMDVLDVGRMAIFADPTGAACALWQPRAHIGAAVVNEPGSLAWNELATRDTAAAAKFYSEIFGWEAAASDLEGMTYTEWKLNGEPIGGMMDMPAEMPTEVPAHWLAYFATADCDVTVATATAAGATVRVPPMDIPPGRFSVMTDPAGAAFAVIALSGQM